MDAASDDVVTKYFNSIDTSQGEQAASCFSSDAIMTIPGSEGTSVVRDGLSEISDALLKRPRQPWTHEIYSYSRAGANLIVKGRLAERSSGDQLSEFIVFITKAPGTGLIKSFRAFGRAAQGTSVVHMNHPSLSVWHELTHRELNNVERSRRYPTVGTVDVIPTVPPDVRADKLRCIVKVDAPDMCGLYWSGFGAAGVPLDAALLLPAADRSSNGTLEFYWTWMPKRTG